MLDRNVAVVRAIFVGLTILGMLRKTVHMEERAMVEWRLPPVMPTWLVVSAAVLACAGARADLREGAMGLWAFNDGDGNVGFDSSGNENHGDLEKGFKWDDGRFGGAGLALNVGRMLVDDSDTVDATEGLTIMVWALHNLNGGFDIPAICSKGLGNPVGGGTDNYALFFWKASGALAFNAQSDAGALTLVTDDDAFTMGEWQHVAFTYGPDASIFYVDGQVVWEGNGGVSLRPNEEVLRFGHGLTQAGPYWWFGRLDEFALYNRPVNAGEISKFVEGGIAGALAVAPQSKLVVTWADLKDGRNVR